MREQIELLQSQARRAKLLIDEADEDLRIQFFRCLSEFEKGRVPNSDDPWVFFMEKLGIRDAKSCRHEIEFLEE